MRRIEKVGPEIGSFVGEAHTRESSIIARFNVIVKGVKKLMGDVRDLRRKAAEKRLSAKRHLHQVIFGDYGGEGKGELDTTPETVKKIFSSTTFTDSCGGSGNKPAGKSLVNDFIYLCAKWIQVPEKYVSERDKSICKYDVTTAVTSDFSNWTKVWHDNNHRICINTPTTQNIHKLVALFERAVDRHQIGSQVKDVFVYVNTTGNPNSVCNTTHVGSICVNYEHALANGGIQWVNQLKNASKDLQDMARYAEESESSLPQLELLEYNALLLYEEAKYPTHLPHIVLSNGTDTNSSNESYEGGSPNSSDTSEEGKLEEEDADSTWKGGPPWWGMLFFFLFDF
ncbi:Variant surface glycoprotein [Trypanosoma congolense IL3000]|uniref:Variant surface glycoprotein n=1 Tax=Trypanosoma congolense (strain IL3000) TaxID=1068625 RepID=F9WA69_TRYCI|nr:Variant surface glycoprotein [Trypanosoma congolense IL3000]